MAATDKHYRDQNSLDVVFALSSIAMLAGLILMLVQDYNREYKVEQRVFRDVEVALAQRAALESLPDPVEFEDAKKSVIYARADRVTKQEEIEHLRSEIRERLPERDRYESRFQMIKGELESRVSFYDIEVENHNPGTEKAKGFLKDIRKLEQDLAEVKVKRDELAEEIRQRQARIDALEAPLVLATGRLKKLNDQFDAQVKTAVQKQWGAGDWFRAWPVLDAFASPVKIHELAIDDVPIDYNFLYVRRYDRCMTCHLGIDKEEFSRANLVALRGISGEQDLKLNSAIQLLRERRRALAGLPEEKQVPDPDALKLRTLSPERLTDARVTEFCAHPRLDLFVGPTSKHPAQKFGCSSCHQGQGSATDFVLASHTPDTSEEEREWRRKYDWESNHMWDFPMLPTRFIESSCLKCHHEVTDLVSTENRIEAPKLLEGFNIIQDVGCFGCHEITGRKAGRNVGPDLRLESSPPLEELTPAQRKRIEADPDTAPGRYRKVGPSLARLAEKTHEEFVRKWIYSPRSFRPDTKMPHYYGLSTNHKDVLPKDQKEFPETEIYAITRFLFNTSNEHLKELQERKKDSAEARQADQEYKHFLNEYLEGRSTMTPTRFKNLMALATKVTWSKLTAPPLLGEETFAVRIGKALEDLNGRLPADMNKDVARLLEGELIEVTRRIRLRDKTPVLQDQAQGLEGDEKRGRILFTERGCMACHMHDGTASAQGSEGDKNYSPPFTYDADFGPSLSQVVEKLGTKKGDRESARIWLVQWLLEPTVHSPRTRMPDTHLSKQDAADIAAWLLSFPKALDVGEKWHEIEIQQPGLKQLNDLASVYLVRILAKRDMEKLLAGGVIPEGQIAELPAAERHLADAYNKAARAEGVDDEERAALREKTLVDYLGRKAVNRLGCYGCHDIPGFETAKPIGVTLNDWGKKSPERLAFEDIKSYVNHHHVIVDDLIGEDGKPVPPEVDTVNGKVVKKMPYEKFYADALFHHTREGFLNQKLWEPRSYDYNRLRPWDDRYRMPQFKFSKFRLPPHVKADRALKQNLESFLAARDKMTVDRMNALQGALPNTAELKPLKENVQDLSSKLVDDVEFETDKEFSKAKIDPKNEAGLQRLYSQLEVQLRTVTGRLPDAADLEGQANLQEAKAREAVATFILGLVAEPVPLHSINQLKGDRLAEVKGRQVLEKFNCNSCHLVRPGYFEFKASPENKEYLETIHGLYLKSSASSYNHPEHYYWTGDEPKNGAVKAMVNWPVTDAEGKKTFPLLEALRFQGTDRSLYDIGTIQPLSIGGDFGIRPKDMITPAPENFAFPQKLDAYLQKHGPFGGTFGEALAQHLMEKTKGETTPFSYSVARSSTPPYLTTQGERTQPEWLHQFLLNPQAVRKMVVLRMPKFNMSEDEARMLVDYFSAVERLNNTGIGLSAPYETVKQRDGLDGEFWKEKNREYVERLKAVQVKGAGGDAKATWFDKRIEELKPYWQQILEDHKERKETAKRRVAEAQEVFDKVDKEYAPQAKQLENLKEALAKKEKEARKDKKGKKEEKDDALDALRAKVQAFEAKLARQRPEWEQKGRALESWKTELDALTKEDERYDVKALQKKWVESEAYLTDSFRLLFHRQLCAQCHQVGDRETPASTPGPNLTMAHDRLRPGWLERWVTNPSYFLHYTPMPVNFKKGDREYQELFVGTSYEQIQAVRDVLMVYPQVSQMPLNRYWILPPALGKEEKKEKKGEEK